MKYILGLILSLLIFIFPSTAFAEEITNFNVNIIAHQDGTMDITEQINYDFGALERHGIFRDIPLVSKVGDLYRVIEIKPKSVLRDGVVENYQLTSSQQQISLKIGNANKTINGTHLYTISYLVKNGIGSNFSDHDEIYWNITGHNWQVPILNASVKLGTDFNIQPDKATCFTGSQGASLKNCDFSKISEIKTTTSLGTYQGLTAVWNFPKGTFPPSILQKNQPSESSSTIDEATIKLLTTLIQIFIVGLNFILAPILLIWYFKNKRKARFGPPTVNFDIPKDKFGKRVSPAEAGSIDIHKVDQNDMVATIFDLAIRKYLKIEQVKEEKVLGIFGGGDDYRLTKLKNSDENMEEFAQILFDRLFESGDTVSLNSLKADFYTTFSKIEKEVFNSLVSRAFYIKNPKNQMALLLFLGVIVFFIGGIILGIVIIILSRKLNGRTALGDEMDWQIDGLKIFLKNMKRYYTFQAQNLYTVEKYIPYAIAFGFIKEFMEQLKIIYPDYEPTWYSGNLAFYVVTNNILSSMSSSITTHAPSSSSGFSGGSSGGGGGGGGGGSW